MAVHKGIVAYELIANTALTPPAAPSIMSHRGGVWYGWYSGCDADAAVNSIASRRVWRSTCLAHLTRM